MSSFKENQSANPKYSVMEKAKKPDGQLDMTELEYRELRELVEETLHLYKSSVDSHNHTLTHLRRVQRELTENKEELEGFRRDSDQRIDEFTRLVADQKLHIKGLQEREAFLVKNFRNGSIDGGKFVSEAETRFGHQIGYDDIPKLVKIFENDPLIVNEIDVLIHELQLSQASKSNLAITKFENIYVKWLKILECWVGQNRKDATYEKLINVLRERNVDVVVDQVEKILKEKRTDWPALFENTE